MTPVKRSKRLPQFPLKPVFRMYRAEIKPSKKRTNLSNTTYKDIIFEAAIEANNIPKEKILSCNRKPEIALTRFLIFYFLKEYTNYGLKTASRQLPLQVAGRLEPKYLDHSSVIHGIRRVQEIAEGFGTTAETRAFNSMQQKIKQKEKIALSIKNDINDTTETKTL